MIVFHLIYDHVDNPWLGGGGAFRAHEMNRRLVASGDEVHVICGGFRSAKNEIRDGVHYWFCPFFSNYFLSRLLFSLFCRRIFAKLLEKITPDIVVDDLSAYSVGASWMVWKKAQISVVHHVVAEHAVRRYGWIGLLFQKLERWNIFSSQKVIAVSQGTADHVRSLGFTGEIEIVHNGVSLPFINEHRLRHNPYPYFLFLGRLDVYNKGIDILMNAYHRYCDLYNGEVHLVLVGSGKDMKKINAMTRNSPRAAQIHLIGHVSEEDKWQWISGCQALLMPSRFEGWGITSIEAQVCGVPVILSRISGLQETIEGVSSGLLFSAENVDEMVHAMKSVQDNPVYKESARRNAPVAQKLWGWESKADLQRKCYLKTMDEHHGDSLKHG